MVDVEFRVNGTRREGFLLALGQLVIASGFTLLRQRMTTEANGVLLVMVVRGPQDRLLQLEDNLGSHPLVIGFESGPADGAAPAVSPAPAAVPAAKPAPQPVKHAAAPVSDARVEALLPQMARDYPRIFMHLHALDHDLNPEQRESVLRYIGQRVGAWVYKRDFALGGRLGIQDAIRHIALPAMRQLVDADIHGDALAIVNSPFCYRGHTGQCCHFFSGMLTGLLSTMQGGESLRVVETRCRNTGGEACSFEFHT